MTSYVVHCYYIVHYHPYLYYTTVHTLDHRDVAIRVGQTLVDTNRLKIVSSPESQFRDEIHLYLELGGDAHLPLENPKEPTVQGAPKWFHNLPQDGDSEFESSYGPRRGYSCHCM